MSFTHGFGRRGARHDDDHDHGHDHGHDHDHGPGHRHGHRHGRGGGGRGGREGRVFEHGDLRLVIMALLAEKPRYGYEIIKTLEERVGGGYSPSPGVVYPNLTLLEELGHATVSADHGSRRLYTPSEEGLRWLDANRHAANAILLRIDEAATHHAGPPPQVERALDNLAAAVRLRLKGRQASDVEIRAIADAIDAAARAVEMV
jgi:DNA-binding PadR family transcriptional regulator